MEPTSIALTQISILVNNLSKKNLSQSVESIKQILEEFGLEVERHYLRCLFTTINTSDLQSSQLHLNLLIAEIKNQITKPYFNTNICFCFESYTNNNQNKKTLKTVLSNLLPEICKSLSSVEKVHEIIFLVALSNCTFAPEVQKYSEEQLKQVAPKLFDSYLRNDLYRYQDTTLVDLLPDTLQILLLNFDKFGISSYLKQETLLKLQSDYPIEQTPLILVPLIYPSTNPLAIDVYENLDTNQIMETSWSSLLKEIGYEFTSSVEDCKNHLKCGGSELQPCDIAKIISFMCKTHTSLNDGNANNLPAAGAIWSSKNVSNNNSENSEKSESEQSTDNKSESIESANADSSSSGSSAPTWKLEIFVQAIKEILPTIAWKDVCVQLDHRDFFIRDRQGLNLLLTIFRLGTGGTLFPTECIYRHWQNVTGQLSLITTILKNPDVFSFADYIFTSAPVELLKTPPENENKEVATWKSLHLVDTLLYIADHQPHGQQCYRQVHEIFSFPMKQCPDVLFMALLQINPPITGLRIELFKSLIPIFLGSHSNSGIILHQAWNSNTLPALQQLIMNSMSECYLRSDCDQTKLSRILDVAQDLKALSSLLNARSFMFVIDLACLASRREYLKLEKWLGDKIREHGEPFVQAIVKFLQRRCPQIMGKADEQQLMIPKSVQLPLETVTTMVACLQSCAGNVQQELCDLILQMSNYCNILAKQARQQQPSSGVPPLTTSTTTPGPTGSNLNLIRQQPPPGPGSHHQNPPIGPPFNPQQMFGGVGLGGAGLGGALGGMGVGVDALAHLNSNMAGLNLNGPNGAFNFNNVLNNLVSTPSSPSRMMNANTNSNSPFPMMVNMQQHQQQSHQQQQQQQQQQQPPHSGLPRIPTTPNSAGHENVLPELNQQVSKEVEDEANSYFQRIYNHPPHPTLSIDEVLDMLQRFKEYQGCREQEVYQCMIRNLFEEYRFFPQYPDKELLITAQLFGGIIDRNLVPTFLALGLALRCVLDALRKPEGYKMYYFGIVALDRFKSRLNLYSKYCEFVKTIQHFPEFPQHLIQYVEYGSIGQEPPNKPQGPVLPPNMAHLLTGGGAPANVQQSPSVESLYRSNSAAAQLQQQQQQKPQPIQQSSSIAAQQISSRAVKSIATATNIDTLLSANTEREEKVTNPPDTVADKTAFIFNNLSQLNLQQKCEEIKEIMTQEYWPWLSQYLVLKRASIELNFHSLYSNFLDAMKNKEVLRLVTRETFRNIRVLLRSEKHANNFSDRTLLKNLGHWLGMMTLGRNRPILAIDIDLKSLLVEAFHKGQQELLFIVPFVAKVLESCSKSKIFKPPNPWTMAIMNVLGELHTEPDLKLNLKFEIEVLCKTLNLDHSKLRPVFYLKDPDRIMSIELQLSQPKAKQIQEITQADLQMAAALQQHQSFRNIEDSAMVLLNNPSIVSNPSPSISNDSAGASTGVGGQMIAQPPPEPKFSYIELAVNNYNSISQYAVVNHSSLGMLANNPAVKHTLTTAIERTITEWLQPLVDRSVRIAVQTTEQIVRKDFALDHDENRMRVAAHHMVRNLASGLAMITCKDQLIQALTGNLRKAFAANGAPNSAGYQDNIDAACHQLAQDNYELVCAFMQKTAGEKALPEIDRRIAHDFEVRKTARDEGRRYCEAESLTYQAERMPEQVRLKMGAASTTQFAVYTEFARTIPGFITMNEREISLLMPKNTIQDTPPTFSNVNVGGGGITATANSAADEMSIHYSDLAAKIEAFITNAQHVSTLQLQLTKMHALLKALVTFHRQRDTESGYILVTRVVEALMEGLTTNISSDQVEQMKLYRNISLRTLTVLQSTFGANITERVVTKCVSEIREDPIRFNLEAMKLLISSHFINMPHYDNNLVAIMDNGTNYLAVTFSMQLVQHFLIDERGNTQITEQDFCNTVDMLARLAAVHRGPEGLGNLIEHLRNNHDPNMFSADRMGPTQFIHSGMNSVRHADCDDPPDLHEKTMFLLKDWCAMFSTMNGTRDTVKNFGLFVQKMNMYGILKTDDLITRFFRQATQFCIDIVYINTNEQNPAAHRQMIFKWMDAYVRLILLLVRHSGDASNPATKINLLNKVLGIVVGVLLQDHEVRGTNFQQIGYQRFFTILFIELSSSDSVIESVMLSVVTAFSHAYHFLNPSYAPGFSYAWLELISHRVFLSRILAQIPQQKGWPLYCQLLLDLFRYLAPFLRNTDLAKPIQILYKGTLRVLLVLLHDFPEFLCDYHFAFCDAIPSNCIQMRNIILAAFPRNMRLPDPFTPNLKAHMLLETAQAPKIFSNYVNNIEANFKKNLDSYLKARSPVTFLSEIRTHLQSSKEPGSVYNIPLINALVLYVGTQAIAHISSKNQVPSASNIASSAHIDIFQNLAVDLDHEGRYLFLNAIANQLRYPNSHTQYFSCVVLHLFAQANSEAIQEQITRVLLERLIVNRPHPWGLLVTFIELIKEPVYKFWDHEFVHCAPEIEKLFESVARSCNVKANHQPQQLSIDGEIQELN